MQGLEILLLEILSPGSYFLPHPFLLLFRPLENKTFHFPCPLFLHGDIHSLGHLKGHWKGRGWPLLLMQGELEKFCIWPCHIAASGLSAVQSVLAMPSPRGQPNGGWKLPAGSQGPA